MSFLPTAKTVCERALRKIGAFSINDTAARQEDLLEALYWLDAILAQVSAINRAYWLIQPTVSFSLDNDTASVDLLDALGEDAPDDGIQFPIKAWIEDEDGNRQPLDLVAQQDIENEVDQDQTGVPTKAYIDRLNRPTMRFFPKLPTTNTTDYTVVIMYQSFSPQIAPETVTAFSGAGNRMTSLREAWTRWAIFQLSADIGDGPVRTLPSTRIQAWREEANSALEALVAYENRAHTSTDPVVEPQTF